MTGIIGAFDPEVAPLAEDLTAAKNRTIQGIEFRSGILDGRHVVIATSGIGKVNAALTSTLLIEHFQPEQVLMVGIAGAVDPDLEPGDVVIAERAAYYDMGEYTPGDFLPQAGRIASGGDASPSSFACDSGLVTLSHRVLNEPLTLEELEEGLLPVDAYVGVVVSGDAFIASSAKRRELRDQFNADAVDMESAAVAQVCWRCDVPFLVIRGISDQANEAARIDATTHTEAAILNVTNSVRRVLSTLNER